MAGSIKNANLLRWPRRVVRPRNGDRIATPVFIMMRPVFMSARVRLNSSLTGRTNRPKMLNVEPMTIAIIAAVAVTTIQP